MRLGYFSILNFKLLIESFRFGNDNARQEQETNQVRNGHQTVEDVG